MTVGMLEWLEEPDPDRGIRFARDGEGWDFWSYERLAAATWSAAEQLLALGVAPGGIVAIVVPSGPTFVATFCASLVIGATPAPLVPPTLFEDEERYVEHTGALIGAAADAVVTEPFLAALVARAGRRGGLDRAPLLLDLDTPVEEGRTRRPPAPLALLQFTSGSSGLPRGVRVRYENLEANIAMIRDWIDWGPDDVGAHWLPLYHDMGLIGCLLTPLVHQRDLWILRPEQFVLNPERWLDCFGRGPAVFTAGPNFCFSFAASRIDPATLEGSDFSRWKAAFVGAERLDPGALERFARMLQPYGFSPQVFLPAYGLAEATLAVTGVAPERVPNVVRPDWDSLSFGAPVAIESKAELGDPGIGTGGGSLVGCGGALPGVSVRIVDEEGLPLPDGSLGEIELGGPTVADGYHGAVGGSVAGFDDGRARTGDAGFLHDGDLYVVGRLGDSIKVRGRTLYAEELEARLASLDGVPRGRCVVLPGSRAGEGVVAIVEGDPGTWVEPAARMLRREVGRDAQVRIFTGSRGTILRTSSGKPRRRVMWRAALDGGLDLNIVRELTPGGSG